MRRYLRENKHVVLLALLLVAASGCAGAVKKTGDQLSNDALKPVSVPVEGYLKAKDVAGKADQQTQQENQQIEQIK